MAAGGGTAQKVTCHRSKPSARRYRYREGGREEGGARGRGRDTVFHPSRFTLFLCSDGISS